MFLTNHTLTGLVLGLNIADPVLLAPTALASHFALDAIPHYGDKRLVLDGSATGKFKFILLSDGALSVALCAFTVLMWPQQTLHLAIGIFFATLPDLLYIPRQIFNGWVPSRLYARFHKTIQWAEIPSGWTVELAWAYYVSTLIAKFA